MNLDPLEPSVEAQTTKADPFSFRQRPREVSDSTGTDFNHVSSDQFESMYVLLFFIYIYFVVLSEEKFKAAYEQSICACRLEPD